MIEKGLDYLTVLGTVVWEIWRSGIQKESCVVSYL